MLGWIANQIEETIEEVCDVADGILEGEIRTRSASRLAAKGVVAYGASELMDFLSDEDD